VARVAVKDRPDIVLGNGRVFRVIEKIAEEVQLHPRTLKRLPGVEIAMVGGCAFGDPNQVKECIVANAKVRNQEPKRRKKSA
jgi:hypothetical protein